jgi:hypothetical protein
MEDARRVKFNVGGRPFETTWATLKRIPTLYHMMTDCQDHSEMFIDRSPMLFEQVFAFVVDAKHPFPLRYSYELDWYDVVYDKSLLYDDEAVMKTMDKNNFMSFAILQNATISTACINRWEKCRKILCGAKLSNIHKPICKNCDTLCIEPTCTALIRRHNYCLNHQMTNDLCNKRSCYNNAVINMRYCGLHIKTLAPEKINI